MVNRNPISDEFERLLDFSNRAMIGFDRFMPLLKSVSSYPPCDIIKIDDDTFCLSLAVAGFKKDELSIELDKNILSIKGVKTSNEKEVHYLHQGIAKRSFEKKIALADNYNISNASMEDGLLNITVRAIHPEPSSVRIAIE